MPPGRPAREAIAGLETRRRRTLTDRRGRRAIAARPHRVQGAPARDSGNTSREHSVILHRRSGIRRARHSGTRLRHSGTRLRRSGTPHRAAAVRVATAAVARHAVIAAAEARAVPAAATVPAGHTGAAAVDGAATGSARHSVPQKPQAKPGASVRVATNMAVPGPILSQFGPSIIVGQKIRNEPRQVFRTDEAPENLGAIHLLAIVLVVADELRARSLPFFEL